MSNPTDSTGRSTGAKKVGVVVSHATDKTAVVKVERTVNHPAYRRYVRRSVKFMAHDEKNSCKVGDTVEIVECRPLSARKRWRVRRVVRSAVAGLHDRGTAAPSPGR
jgi:small subunit ribosomal protein S17